MTFAYILKTVITKWINTLSKKGFSTALVRQETQMPMQATAKAASNQQQTCCLK